MNGRGPERGRTRRDVRLAAVAMVLAVLAGGGAVWAAEAGDAGDGASNVVTTWSVASSWVTPGSVAPGLATPTAPPSAAPLAPATTDTTRGTVVLLHGLGRTHRSMRPVEAALEEAGYRVVNLGYESRVHPVPALADTLAAALDRCCDDDPGPVHFVTHSLGGIVVRQFLASHPFDRLGRVVMLSPPNQGSEVIDRLPDDLVDAVLGPAGAALATDSTGITRQLPPVRFDLGIITGDASLNPLFSWWLPGEDDGKVSVRSAWVDGADAFLVVPYGHTFIMRRSQVMRQVVAFLATGAFLPDAERPDSAAAPPAAATDVRPGA